MNKKTKMLVRKYLIRVAIFTASLVLIIGTAILSYLIAYNGKIYPNISVAGVNIAGNTQADAILLLSKNIITPSEITLIYQDQTYPIKTSDIDLHYDFYSSTRKAYEFVRTGNIFTDIQKRIILLFNSENLGLITNFDGGKLSKLISIVAGQISIDPVNPSVSKTSGGISVERGLAGREVSQEQLTSLILQYLTFNQKGPISIPVENIDNTLTVEQADALSARAERLLGKSIVMKHEYDSITLKDTDIFALLGAEGGYNEEAITGLIQKSAPTFEREPQNPKFVFENGKVTEFQPALDGIEINREDSQNLIRQKLVELERNSNKSLSFDIPVVRTPPEIDTGQVNDFGIRELIGRGTSTYFHSIPGRVHNVSLAASRINGTLVKPGETFSFNNTLGDVSAFTGYQQAYIISGGKTILGDGGGVCQVSTTLFRAILDAGLPIVERQAHAYRVGYYEQDSPPGIDATVFSPSPDLKFINDTGHYILIEATADTKNYSLVFELYGASDGRVASISKPVVTNVTAPPPDLYQDDPTLPAGTVKQVDYKAWGARVSFDYIVTRGGREIINKTFISNYKPWQAIYLRGTGPAQ